MYDIYFVYFDITGQKQYDSDPVFYLRSMKKWNNKFILSLS